MVCLSYLNSSYFLPKEGIGLLKKRGGWMNSRAPEMLCANFISKWLNGSGVEDFKSCIFGMLLSSIFSITRLE